MKNFLVEAWTRPSVKAAAQTLLLLAVAVIGSGVLPVLNNAVA
jgi:hypothetical protein